MVKVGGSVITDTSKPMVARPDEIARLLTEIWGASRESGAKLILGHGSGSFGHNVAKQYRVNEGLVDGDSKKGAVLTRLAAAALDRIVIEKGVELGMAVMPFAPSSFALSSSRRIDRGIAYHIRHAISSGFIPVVYGDLMVDTEQGVSIAPTEEVFRFIATKLRPDRIIIGTDVDGVFDSDPARNSSARLIGAVDSSNIREVTAGAGGSNKVDVTGGMRTKVQFLYDMAVATGARCYITNAARPGSIAKIMKGEEADVRCTVITR